MPKRIDLEGQKFGKLTVLSFSHIDESHNCAWKCECDCGNIVYARADLLRKGKKTSCTECIDWVICPECGKEFQSDKPNKIFCSDKCRVRQASRRQKRSGLPKIEKPIIKSRVLSVHKVLRMIDTYREKTGVNLTYGEFVDKLDKGEIKI